MTDQPLIFRPATPADAAPIRDFVRAAYARWVPIVGREPRPMQADYELAVREHVFDIATRGGDMLGLIETIPRDDHLWIENIAIGPAQQGKGLGTFLMQRAEDRARFAGLPESRLVTNIKMEANIALYQKRGYVIDHEEAFMGGTAVYMIKPLKR